MKTLHRSLFAIAAVAAIATAAFAHAADKKKTEIATFAGGCFWCMESPYDDVKGVISTTSGYTGGTMKNPTYRDVCTGKTGHAESEQVEFDPSKVSYETLLQVYWHNIDPTQSDGQFCDHGDQYRPEIFYHDEAQRVAAEASKKEMEKRFGAVTVKIEAASTFYPAEEYHQGYCTKNSDDYHDYRAACGRDRRLKEIWGDDAGIAHAKSK